MRSVIVLVLCLLSVLFVACGGDDPGDPVDNTPVTDDAVNPDSDTAGSGTGTLVFAGVANGETPVIAGGSLKDVVAEATTHLMHGTGMDLWVTEVSVSQGLVADGVADTFTWEKIGESDAIKPIPDYLFTDTGLPVGEYQSIKMVFKNTIVMHAVYHDDQATEIEMPSSLDQGSCGDETLITQYFSPNGNHSLEEGVFHVQAAGEKSSAFTIKEGKTTTIKWQLGKPGVQLTDCSFEWVDANGNGAWDCGVDSAQNAQCSVPNVMFYFSVEEE
ncbi:MAG TPA: hypothetical protein P5077_00175 [bacterium]|nr:hypothetical protein [bacterium]